MVHLFQTVYGYTTEMKIWQITWIEKAPAQLCHDIDPEEPLSSSISWDLPVSKCILIFDQTNLEWSATPLGVGMEDGDCIHLILQDDDTQGNCLQAYSSAIKSKRKSEIIRFGLNLTIDEGLPVIHGASSHLGNDHPNPESALVCRSQLKAIQNVLFKAFDMTLDTFTLPKPEHFPDFSKIKSKLRLNTYDHADSCLSDVYDVLSRYENSAHVLTGSGRSTEGERRLGLKRDLGKTFKEFQQAIQTYNADGEELEFKEFWKKDQKNSITEVTIVIGPVRDFVVSELENALPSVFLTGVKPDTTLEDLIYSYNFYTKLNIEEELDMSAENFPTTYFCLHEEQSSCKDLRCLFGSIIKLQTYASVPVLFNLSFPSIRKINRDIEDPRNVDALVNYIEGCVTKKKQLVQKEKEKKKTRKKKKNPSVGSGIETSVGCGEAQNTSASILPVVTEHQKTNDEEQKESISVSLDSLTVPDTQDVESVDNSEFTVITKKWKSGGKSAKPPSYRLDVKQIKYGAAKETKIVSEQLNALDMNGPAASNEPNLLLKKTRTAKSEKPKNLHSQLHQLEKEYDENEQRGHNVMKKGQHTLSQLQEAVETCGDKIYTNEKKCVQLDAEIAELESQKRDILAQNAPLEQEKEKYKNNRLKEEHELERKMAPLKDKKRLLLHSIKTVKEKISQSIKNTLKKDESNSQIPTINKAEICASQDPLLEFLTAQIGQKELDLECPVCLETSQTPIYMCMEQHIVCSNCWQQVIRSRYELQLIEFYSTPSPLD